MANTTTNEELAARVVETFLPNSVETLESLAGSAAIIANDCRTKAIAARRAEAIVGGISGEADRLLDSARRHEAIAARFRAVIAGERLAHY